MAEHFFPLDRGILATVSSEIQNALFGRNRPAFIDLGRDLMSRFASRLYNSLTDQTGYLYREENIGPEPVKPLAVRMAKYTETGTITGFMVMLRQAHLGGITLPEEDILKTIGIPSNVRTLGECRRPREYGEPSIRRLIAQGQDGLGTLLLPPYLEAAGFEDISRDVVDFREEMIARLLETAPTLRVLLERTEGETYIDRLIPHSILDVLNYYNRLEGSKSSPL